VGVLMGNFADYSLNSRLRVKQSLFVGDPDDAIAAPAQPMLAFDISFRHRINPVNSTVNFDDDPFLMTNEVDNIGAERRLPSKVGSVHIQLPQKSPQAFFRWRRLRA
jgi:hypothetical protein